MMKKRIFYPTLCILATALSLNAQLDWNSANADGDWNTPESWDLGVLPTATDFARINGGNATVSGVANADKLTTGGANTFTVDSGGLLTVTTDIFVGEAGSFASLEKYGTLQLNPGGQIDVSRDVQIGSWNDAGQDSVLNMAGGTFNIGRRIAVGSGSTGTLNLSGGTLDVSAGTWHNLRIGDLAGDGTVNITGGNLITTGMRLNNGELSNSILNLDGGTLTIYGDFSGAIKFGSNSSIAISGGVLEWEGNRINNLDALVTSGEVTFATSSFSTITATAEQSWTSSDGTTTLYADFDEVKSGFTTFWASSNDADGDGLADGVETNTGTFVDASNTGTDPNDPDTDDDGLEDGVETNTGTFVSASDTGTDPHVADTDSDGLADGAETGTGTFVDATNTGTNPLLPDTDGDTISDGVETGLDPNTNSQAAIDLLPSTGGGVEQSVHDAVVTELANAREARAGSTVIDVANDLADITLRVEQTSDVSDWSNATTSDHTIQLSAPAGASFYRFTIPE